MKTSMLLIAILVLCGTSASAKSNNQKESQINNYGLIEVVKMLTLGIEIGDDLDLSNLRNVNLNENIVEIENRIEENNKIIEANIVQIQPLCSDKCIEDVISEDRKIIENAIPDILYPLDFSRINVQKLENSNLVTF